MIVNTQGILYIELSKKEKNMHSKKSHEETMPCFCFIYFFVLFFSLFFFFFFSLVFLCSRACFPYFLFCFQFNSCLSFFFSTFLLVGPVFNFPFLFFFFSFFFKLFVFFSFSFENYYSTGAFLFRYFCKSSVSVRNLSCYQLSIDRHD